MRLEDDVEEIDQNNFWSTIEGLTYSGSRNLAPIRELSKKYSLFEWLQISRTFEVNQFYFAPLLPNIKFSKNALLVDDSYGCLAAQLSQKIKHVYSVVESERELAFCRHYLTQKGVANVTLLEPGQISAEVEKGAIDLMVLVRPSAVVQKQKKLMQLKLPSYLAENTVVWITETNQFGLRRLLSTKLQHFTFNSMQSPNWWNRLFLEKKMEIRKYWALAGSNNMQSPRISLSGRKDELNYYVGLSYWAKLKRYIKNFGFLKYISSGYCFCAYRGTQGSWFDSVLNLAEIKSVFEDDRDYEINKIMAGNKGVTLIFFGNGQRETVWRVSSGEEGKRRVENNAKALQDLAEIEHSSGRVPRLLYFGAVEEYCFSIEEKTAGHEPSSDNRELSNQLGIKGLDWMLAFQSANQRVTKITEKVYMDLVSPRIQSLAYYCDERESEVLAESDALLKSNIIGREIPLVPLHGDFKAGNVLFDSSGELQSIIDWDMYHPRYLPLIDLFIYLIFKSKVKGVSFPDAFSKGMLLRYVSGDYQNLIANWQTSMKLDENTVHAMLILSWIIAVDGHVSWMIKVHDKTVSQLITNGLSKANDLLR